MKYVLVLGYGYSGSSAVCDLLREVDGFYCPDIEFRLIKDPGGLMDLRYNIVERWEPLNIDHSVKRFRWLAGKLCQPMSIKKGTFGFDYVHSFNPTFLQITDDFIDSVASFSYQGTWHYFSFEDNKWAVRGDLLKLRLGKKPKTRKMYYCSLLPEEFDRLSSCYLDSLFRPWLSSGKTVVLDQAIPVQDPEVAQFFFRDYQTIIVDRDPRDIYCDLIKQRELISERIRVPGGEAFFVEWFKKYREKRFDSPNILRIRFSDLVLNYDATVSTIFSKLGIAKDSHLFPKKYFDPNRSIKNIGLWKHCDNKEAIRFIENELTEYLDEE